MELEQQRGISITSTVLQFPYRDHVVNLLDTPGHRDFSEDTYRVLAAADAAVMVLDAAKGIEPQTLKLFEVCRDRGLPLLTFINKWDRPGRDPLELLDEIERLIGVHAHAGHLAGRHRRRLPRRGRPPRPATSSASPASPRGATEAPEELVDAERAAAEEGEAWTGAQRGARRCSTRVGADFDDELVPRRASPRRRSSAPRSPTSACACCSTR